MKQKIIHIAGFIAIQSLHAFAQNSNPWPTSGSVGIGTSSPTTILDVAGGYIRAQGASSG